MRGKGAPRDRKRTLRMSFRAQWRPGLDLPQEEGTGGWRQHCQGGGSLSQDCPHRPSGHEETADRSSAQALRAVTESERRRGEAGRAWTQGPRLWALAASQTPTGSPAKRDREGRCCCCHQRAPDFSPHATPHAQMHMARPAGTLLKTEKQEKAQLLFKEMKALRLLGPFPRGLRSAKQLPSSSAASF